MVWSKKEKYLSLIFQKWFEMMRSVKSVLNRTLKILKFWSDSPKLWWLILSNCIDLGERRFGNLKNTSNLERIRYQKHSKKLVSLISKIILQNHKWFCLVSSTHRWRLKPWLSSSWHVQCKSLSLWPPIPKILWVRTLLHHRSSHWFFWHPLF